MWTYDASQIGNSGSPQLEMQPGQEERNRPEFRHPVGPARVDYHGLIYRLHKLLYD